MSDEIIWGSIIVLLILFVFIVPAVLYAALKKLADPVPVYLPVLLALFIPVVFAGIRMQNLISESDVITGTLVSFFFLFLLMDLAALAPFMFFEKKSRRKFPRAFMAVPVFIGFFFLFYMTAGETYSGRPMPPLSAPLPLTGWILDGIVSVLGLQGPVYAFGSPLYAVLRIAGLWLEVLIIATVFYGILLLQQESSGA